MCTKHVRIYGRVGWCFEDRDRPSKKEPPHKRDGIPCLQQFFVFLRLEKRRVMWVPSSLIRADPKLSRCEFCTMSVRHDLRGPMAGERRANPPKRPAGREEPPARVAVRGHAVFRHTKNGIWTYCNTSKYMDRLHETVSTKRTIFSGPRIFFLVLCR